MSVRESSELARGDVAHDDAAQFTRWPGLLSLSLGVLLGPVVALVNQSLIYAANMWVCGRNLRGALHIIPALGLVVVAGTAVGAFLNWNVLGQGVEDEREPVVARARFLALLGIAISIFSALVIVAQWLAIFVFQPCQRA